MKTFNEVELTNEQHECLSLMAYYNRNMLIAIEDKGCDKYIAQMRGGYNATRAMCDFLKVPQDLTYNVAVNNYAKGLRNCNKVTSPDIWEY